MSETEMSVEARLIAERLFTNGQNKKAARLRLELQDKSDGGGWSFAAAYDQIKQVTEPLQAKVAEQAATIERLTELARFVRSEHKDCIHVESDHKWIARDSRCDACIALDAALSMEGPNEASRDIT